MDIVTIDGYGATVRLTKASCLALAAACNAVGGDEPEGLPPGARGGHYVMYDGLRSAFEALALVIASLNAPPA